MSEKELFYDSIQRDLCTPSVEVVTTMATKTFSLLSEGLLDMADVADALLQRLKSPGLSPDDLMAVVFYIDCCCVRLHAAPYEDLAAGLRSAFAESGVISYTHHICAKTQDGLLKGAHRNQIAGVMLSWQNANVFNQTLMTAATSTATGDPCLSLTAVELSKREDLLTNLYAAVSKLDQKRSGKVLRVVQRYMTTLHTDEGYARMSALYDVVRDEAATLAMRGGTRRPGMGLELWMSMQEGLESSAMASAKKDEKSKTQIIRYIVSESVLTLPKLNQYSYRPPMFDVQNIPETSATPYPRLYMFVVTQRMGRAAGFARAWLPTPEEWASKEFGPTSSGLEMLPPRQVDDAAVTPVVTTALKRQRDDGV